MDVLVVEDAQGESDGDGEEADVTEERSPLYAEGRDERHGAAVREQKSASAGRRSGSLPHSRDNRGDETGGAQELSDGEASRVAPER